MKNKIVKKLFHLMKKNGSIMYGEKITQKRHALTVAHILRDTTPCLQVAGLLHDIAYFLPEFEKYNELKDNMHEIIGSEYLMSLGFPPSVYEPVRNHVKAKRYFAYKNPNLELSEASRKSLIVQGGVMTKEESEDFENSCFFPHSCLLRFADDKSKDYKGYVPPLSSYRKLVESLLN